jgi:hypothetical protein
MWDLTLDHNPRSCADEPDLIEALEEMTSGHGQELVLAWSPGRSRRLDAAIDRSLGATTGSFRACRASTGASGVTLTFIDGDASEQRTDALSPQQAERAFVSFFHQRLPPVSLHYL